MTDTELKALVADAQARFEALSPAEQEAHMAAQKASFVRSAMLWPKPNYHWEGNTKVYHSYEDYCND